MYGRRNARAAPRRGHWSNCERYWTNMSGSGQPNGQYNPPPPGMYPNVQQPNQVAIPPSSGPGGVNVGYQAQPPVAQWNALVWPGPWQVAGPWAMPPAQVPLAQPAQPLIVQPPPAAAAPVAVPVAAIPAIPPANGQLLTSNHPSVQNAHSEENRPMAAGKGPSANAFPGPGNRAYFTKEYMDLLEEIKTTKVLDGAKKRIAVNRRSAGLQISGNSGESHTGQHRSNEKSDEMKVWVSSTLRDSLKLITKKLEEVDAKASVTASEKEELIRLRAEKAALEKAACGKAKESSSEKRKRATVAPGVPTVQAGVPQRVVL
ncbi:hypothetical protein CBR_g57844 [Chara braunii]|uniref:Uncharacterized protein n=1 Tax=Chara braunii TaxID=69332 RepID=A0A388K852_CHABU|nr:hypothetical protein CBR_g57844 [Chara braunii]|eukprot:GBG66242.1 hypothetical protein CBR_g57844 [Chara braunii]